MPKSWPKRTARQRTIAAARTVTLDAAERSAALTQRLLAFGRRQLLEPRATDANQLLRDMDDLIERAAGRGKIVYELAENLWPAMVDPGQLETAVLNLVVNSRDAMPSGGGTRSKPQRHLTTSPHT